MLLKFKSFLNKKNNNSSKSFKHLGKCHNYSKLGHWANSCPKPKKLRIDKGSNSWTKFARFHIKGEEVQQLEFEEVANVVEGQKAKEDEFEDNVDYFEAIVANLKP